MIRGPKSDVVSALVLKWDGVCCDTLSPVVFVLQWAVTSLTKQGLFYFRLCHMKSFFKNQNIISKFLLSGCEKKQDNFLLFLKIVTNLPVSLFLLGTIKIIRCFYPSYPNYYIVIPLDLSWDLLKEPFSYSTVRPDISYITSAMPVVCCWIISVYV